MDTDFMRDGKQQNESNPEPAGRIDPRAEVRRKIESGDGFVTRYQLAAFLEVSPRSITRWVAQRKFPKPNVESTPLLWGTVNIRAWCRKHNAL